jgi:hypothetical protein
MNDHRLVNDEGSLTFEKLARRLPEKIWKAFEPVLPAVRWCGNGRPPKSNRECFHGAVYVLVSGIDGKRSNAQLRELQKQLQEGDDPRAMPYLRGDGNFAKIPARLEAKREGFRLWEPGVGQS